ncbi:hypothetical protein G9F73_002500 [Clostridium estertheticum]|uniref:hypothetical protein n=1 Tax=Clostridium estertheticum TaxID=238834 RepID=UPI0013EEE2B1|nr:hypothetical protein [Clostridium estertheticum]MBZ9606708.1 hypothetical protein [Clostridium estertheticum]
MGILIYSAIPYMIWLGTDVFRYNKNLKKGKDTFQINQLVNVMFSSGGLGFYSTNVDFSKDMIATLIGLYAVIYTVYWVICLFVRSKYDRSFMSK